MKLVSKSDLAQILDVSKPRVSQYVSRGLPVREDGKIDYDAAVKWISANVVARDPDAPDKGAKRADRLNRKIAAKRKPEPVAIGASDADISDLLGAILNRVQPAIAEGIVAAGGSCEFAYAATWIILQAISGVAQTVLEERGHVIGSDNEPDGLRWGGIHGEPREPDWNALADRAGETVDVDAWERVRAALPYFDDVDWQPAQSGLEAT